MTASAAAEVRVGNPQGMHLRPSTEFARMVQATGCTVRVKAGDAEADGASVLELAMMAVGPGVTIVITAEGENCETALASLVALVRNDFKGIPGTRGEAPRVPGIPQPSRPHGTA